MKRLLFFLLPLAIWSCGASNSDQAASSSNPAVPSHNTPAEIPAENVDASSLPLNFLANEWKCTFEGSMDGGIAIEIYLERMDNLLYGSITYVKKGIPIKLIGDIRPDNNFFMREYAKGSRVSGMISGTFSKNEMEGSWYPPTGDKERRLSVKASPKPPKSLDWTQTPSNVSGTYGYDFPNEAGSGTLNVKQVGNKINFDVTSVNSAPGYHIATIEEASGKLENGQVRYSGNDGECEFSIRFFRDFAFIDYINEHWECEFGMGASIEGVFVKE